MTSEQAFSLRRLPSSTLSLLLWGGVAVLLGAVLALSGIAGLLGAVALCAFVVFFTIAAKFPVPVMGAAVCCLGLFPWSWGLTTGVLPKLFADESLLLLYLLAFPFLYIFTARRWRHGFAGLYVVLATLLCLQSLSFAVGTDLVAFRNFLETYVLGALLLVLFLQEGANADPKRIQKFVVGLTALIGALSVLERIVQRNPIMEHSTDILYLSPMLARITEGVYRPYVTFFHPSETGTFMALGAPFAIRAWLRNRSWLSLGAVAAIGAGLLVNATRGVWVGVATALLFSLPNAWLIVAASAPVAAIGGWIAYAAFQATPFMQRLTDPNNLYTRFEYWKIAGKIFADHPILGIGHMQFKQIYLDYVRELNSSAQFDISKVFVADNVFLTTTVEHGLLGLFALVAFLVFVGRLLKKQRLELARAGRQASATFVRCSEAALLIYVVTGLFADVHLFTKATKYFFILIGLGLAEGARYAMLKDQAPGQQSQVRAAVQLAEM